MCLRPPRTQKRAIHPAQECNSMPLYIFYIHIHIYIPVSPHCAHQTSSHAVQICMAGYVPTLIRGPSLSKYRFILTINLLEYQRSSSSACFWMKMWHRGHWRMPRRFSSCLSLVVFKSPCESAEMKRGDVASSAGGSLSLLQCWWKRSATEETKPTVLSGTKHRQQKEIQWCL